MKVAEQLQLGDHVAMFYRTKAEQLAFLIPYIKIGLSRNERCLYIADQNSTSWIIRKLQEAGVPTDEAFSTGALQVVTKQETYLRHGIFEPHKMISDLQHEVQVSLDKGYKGLRATGEMTWALDLPSSLARLCEYEADLHARFPSEFIGLCQYDETRFSKAIIDRMTEIHPTIIRNGKLIKHSALSF